MLKRLLQVFASPTDQVVVSQERIPLAAAVL